MNLYDVESKDQKIIGIGADGKQKVYRKLEVGCERKNK